MIGSGLFKERAKPSSSWFNHVASDIEKASMTKIAIIVLAESSVVAEADVFQKGLARNPPGEAGA